MRTIKFRGRDAYGKLHYGDLWQRTDGMILFDHDETVWQRVHPKSIAQFVGYDKDGREVYEGDVLTFEHDGKHYEYTAGLQPFARNGDGLVHYKFDSLKLKEEKKP